MAKVAKNKQMAVLNYIHKQVEDHGYPPTVREICSAVGLSSTSTVHGHISRLIEQGFLQKDPSKPRALEITPKGLDILGVKPIQKEIPMLGVVTAGQRMMIMKLLVNDSIKKKHVFVYSQKMIRWSQSF